jgi:L-threonylcarbamoyladenylate synthase
MTPMSQRARVLAVDARAPDARVVLEAASVLRAGGLVALPTETVYGLAARALDARALERIFLAKGRPTSHPLIAHVVDESQARALAARWTEDATELVRAFWPGPLTIVVDRHAAVPAAIGGGGPSVAIRAPSHAVARAVLAALSEPVAAPSANRYQGLSPTEAAHVVKELGDAVDLILDAGPCEAGIESTVVDVRERPARVLRPGAVGIAQVRSVLPDVAWTPERLRGEEARASPGMQDRHYSPRATLLLADSPEHARVLFAPLVARGESIGLLSRGPVAASLGSPPRPGEAGGVPSSVLARSLPEDPEGYAHGLYAALRDLDDAGATAIVVLRVPDDDVWWAVTDRLTRAAAK